MCGNNVCNQLIQLKIQGIVFQAKPFFFDYHFIIRKGIGVIF